MTWTRLDDRWTDCTKLADLPYEVRWHYLSMIQFCSRTDRLNGVLTLKDARRCSDIDDPDEAHRALVGVGLLEALDGLLRLVEIDEHVPPPSVRNQAEKTKIRMRRSRGHKAGDHSMCLPQHCEKAPVTSQVTRNPGTGQDRTGLALQASRSEEVDSDDDRPFLAAS